MTSIVNAINKGNIAAVRNLISKNISVINKINSKRGNKPLAIAIRKGNTEIVKLLLAAGANAYPKSENVSSPEFAIELAVFDGQYKLAEELIKAGVNPHKRVGYYGDSTLLHLVVQRRVTEGAIKFVKLLIHQYHVKINAKDKLKNTPLDLAISNGTIEFVRILLEEGAKINYQSFYIAIMHGNLNMVRLLVQSKPSLVHIVLRGETPLEYAIKWNRLDIVRLLILAGAKVTQKNLNAAQGKPTILNIIDPKRRITRRVISRWKGAAKKANNNWVKSQMSKGINKVPVSNKATNSITYENFKSGNIGLKVSKQWIQKNGTVARKNYFIKPETLRRLSGKPWINAKGKGNVRSMGRLATVMKDPETRLNVRRRNISPVVFV